MSVITTLKKTNNMNKKLVYCLKDIYGLGLNNSILICTTLQYDINIKLNELSNIDFEKLDNIILLIYEFNINLELRSLKKKNILNLIDIKSYKGIRHQYHLPANGQRTHNNTKTSRRTLFKNKTKNN